MRRSAPGRRSRCSVRAAHADLFFHSRVRVRTRDFVQTVHFRSMESLECSLL